MSFLHKMMGKLFRRKRKNEQNDASIYPMF